MSPDCTLIVNPLPYVVSRASCVVRSVSLTLNRKPHAASRMPFTDIFCPPQVCQSICRTGLHRVL
jgi:hypothetical protein